MPARTCSAMRAEVKKPRAITTRKNPGTVLSTSRSLWFVTLADRAQGKVVEKSEGSPTSLVVAYTPLGGQMQQIHSNGSEAYSDLALGATITVFYDPAQPARAPSHKY